MFTTPWACIITEHIFSPGSGLKKIITLGIGIEKKIMSRDRAGLKTHPVLEHCLEQLSSNR